MLETDNVPDLVLDRGNDEREQERHESQDAQEDDDSNAASVVTVVHIRGEGGTDGDDDDDAVTVVHVEDTERVGVVEPTEDSIYHEASPALGLGIAANRDQGLVPEHLLHPFRFY